MLSKVDSEKKQFKLLDKLYFVLFLINMKLCVVYKGDGNAKRDES